MSLSSQIDTQSIYVYLTSECTMDQYPDRDIETMSGFEDEVTLYNLRRKSFQIQSLWCYCSHIR